MTRARGGAFLRRAVSSDRSAEFLPLAWSRSVPLQMVPCILEAIISGFLDADALKLCVGKRLQAPVNLDAQILGGRYFIEKHRDIFIERFVIEFLENLTFDESVQIG